LVMKIQWDDRSQSKGIDVQKVYHDSDGTIYHNTEHPDQFAVQFPAKLANDSSKPYVLFGDNKRATNLWWWRSDREKILEMNAKGASTIAHQDSDSQNIFGNVSYDDGRYTLMIRRALINTDAKIDVQFKVGTFVPILFHAWDGSRGELGLRHGLTTWYWLYLKPPTPVTSYIVPPIVFIMTLGGLSLIVSRVRRKHS